jgi:hypothetical protein
MDTVRKMVEAGYYLGTLEATFREIKDSLVNGRVTQTIGRLTGLHFKIQSLIEDLSEIQGGSQEGERTEEEEGAAIPDDAQEDPVSATAGTFGDGGIVEGPWSDSDVSAQEVQELKDQAAGQVGRRRDKVWIASTSD